MPHPSVVLVVLARDEESIIERCLRSARDHVDSWLLVDTGSVDRTVEVARQAMRDVPGEVVHVEWRGFGPTRTMALDLAADRADFALMLDADQVLEGARPLLDPAVDAYELTVEEGGTEWRIPRLTRCALRWRYVGATHEFLKLARPAVPLDSPIIRHHADGSSRAAKLERDRVLLDADLAAGSEVERTTFYLAQTLQELGRPERARVLYAQRAEMQGWEEERWFARYSAALLAPEPERTGEMRLAAELRPSRPEPWYWLAAWARKAEDATAAAEAAHRGLANPPTPDRLFVARWMERFGLRFEWAAAVGVLGRSEEASQAFEALAADEAVPDFWRSAARHNLGVLRDTTAAA